MISFARPQYLYAILLLIPLFLFLLWSRYRRREMLHKLGDPVLITRLSESVIQRNRNWKHVLWFFTLLMMVLALARPLWGSQVQVVEQRGLQIMVALDVSNSMLAADIKPSRLERAKLEISDLMDQLAGDEIGLVLFSGSSFIQFPLTSDYATARSFLDYAGPELISTPGTALGEAIQTAEAGFDPQRSSQKVILLITDGEAHDSEALAEAQAAAEKNIKIYAIGFGSAQGEPIPEYATDGSISGYKKDSQGEIVLSKLNESLLQQITSASGGQYYHATAAGEEIANLLDEINALQKEELEQQFEVKGVERFQVFVLAALILMTVSMLLPERRTERKIKEDNKQKLVSER